MHEIEVMTVLARFNPPMEFVNSLRILNVMVGFIACLLLLLVLARRFWRQWKPPMKLGWMALFLLCFTGTYGSFEIAFLDTYFRVPMVTLALIWAIIAAVWPHEQDPRSGK